MLLFESIFGAVLKAGCAAVPVCKTKCLVHGTCHLAIAHGPRRSRAALALATGGAILWATITIQRFKERIMRAMEGLFDQREGRPQPHTPPAHPQDRRQLQEEAPRPRITFGGSPRLLAIENGPRPLAIEDSPRRPDGSAVLGEEAIPEIPRAADEKMIPVHAAPGASFAAAVATSLYGGRQPSISPSLPPINFITEPSTSRRGYEGRQGGARFTTFQEPQLPWEGLVPVGDVYAHGSSDCGVLGQDLDRPYRRMPDKILALENRGIWDISVGSPHNAALDVEGAIWTWGCPDEYALGRAGQDYEPLAVRHMPVPVKKVVCGDSHTAALSFEGQVYICGAYRDTSGVIGFPRREVLITGLPESASEDEVRRWFGKVVGDVQDVRLRTDDEKDENVARVAFWTEAAVDRAAQLRSTFFKAVVPCVAEKQKYPAMVPGLEDVEQVASGDNHTVALSTEGVLMVLGSNEFGQLTMPNSRPGDFMATALPMMRTTEQLGIDGRMTRVWAFGNVTFIAADTGRAGIRYYGCGINSRGELGLGVVCEFVDTVTEVTALRNKHITHMAGGAHHTVALLDDGSFMSWGKQELTGTGTPGKEVPMALPLMTTRVRGVRLATIGAGETHTLATTTNGDVLSWGFGGCYQLGTSLSRLSTDKAFPDVRSVTELAPYCIESKQLCDMFVLKADGSAQHSIELAWTGKWERLRPFQPTAAVAPSDGGMREDTEEAEAPDRPFFGPHLPLFGRDATSTFGPVQSPPIVELSFQGSSPSLPSFQSAPLFGLPQQADKDSGTAAPAAGAAEGAASASPSSSSSSRRRGRRGRLSGPSLSFGTGVLTGHQGSGAGAALFSAAAAAAASSSPFAAGGAQQGGEGGFGPTQEGVQLFQGATGDLQYGSSASSGRRRQDEGEEEDDSWMDAKRKRR
ncbi:unnamed protein product [Vitrella brassicaformis CCMP3155]|uniref:RRM domain-containing protein n=1 Tax=Vitrella brassicaformis (strain CCMP3155) TaxID=1169540 RepID=A0A0G4H8R6_VITBC|nr:unnamed protein product [Vitrella brassicaformis CCMP3155]|eukprot:CEM40089.1 unnamed protein product [Vitrella brassicaformis CCMP3155]